MDMSAWQDETGFLSFSHKDYPPDKNDWHGKGFGDSVDSTAIWLTQCKINGTKTDGEIREILYTGLQARTTPSLKILRFPGSNEEITKDQLDFLIPLMRSVGLKDWAGDIVKQYGDTWLPHRRDNLTGKYTLLGYISEMIDAVFDWYSGSMVSQMNNLSRLLWASYNGHPRELAVSLFRKKLDPYFIMVVFGSRRAETGAGKDGEELKKVFQEVFENALVIGPTNLSPPPIYLGYKEILKEWL